MHPENVPDLLLLQLHVRVENTVNENVAETPACSGSPLPEKTCLQFEQLPLHRLPSTRPRPR